MKTNYEILGLPENAPKEIIDKKYGALLRQYKQHVDEHGATYEDLAYYESITKAYDELTGREHDFTDDNPTSPIPYKIRRRWGKFVSWIENYKLLILIIGLVIFCVVVFILQKDIRNEDIYIKFVGAYTVLNIDDFCEDINEKSEAVNSSLTSFFTVTTGTEYSTVKENEATQFLTQYRAGYLDVILIDKESYDAFIEDFTFMKLDDFLEENKDNPAFASLECYRYVPTGDETKLREPEEGVYGIEIKDSTFFDDTELKWLYDEEKGQEKTMILTIAATTKRLDMAKSFAIELIESINPDNPEPSADPA